MPGISDTAYPRLKPDPSAKELEEIYTPNLFECGWVEERTRERVPRIGLFVLLKTFQRLRQRYELSAFSTILRAARTARAEINQRYHNQVRESLSDEALQKLSTLLARPAEDTQSAWDRLKQEPKQATTQNTRDFLEHLDWLREYALPSAAFAGVPDVKVKQFAAEARSLDLSSIHDCAEPKRLTLTAALVVVQTARALDDVADMFVRLVHKVHTHAKEALLNTRQITWTEPILS